MAEQVPFLVLSFRVTTMNQKVMMFFFFWSAYCMIGMDWVYYLHLLLFYSSSPNKHILQMKMWTESLTDLHEATWALSWEAEMRTKFSLISDWDSHIHKKMQSVSIAFYSPWSSFPFAIVSDLCSNPLGCVSSAHFFRWEHWDLE